MISVNEAGVQIPKPNIRDRWRLLFRVIKWFFKPEMYNGIHQEIDEYGRIVVSGWIRKPNDIDYKYHYVAYDGKSIPSAYVDGLILEDTSKNEVKRIGKVIEIE